MGNKHERTSRAQILLCPIAAGGSACPDPITTTEQRRMMMRFLPTRVHGIMDYLMGALLIALPFLARFPDRWATWVPVALGAGALVYSMLTNYELGLMPVLSMPAHLGMDAAGGLLLAASPWLFGFSSVIWMPHLILGLMEIGAALVTQTVPSHGARRAGPSPIA